jgi:hypothetical protein
VPDDHCQVEYTNGILETAKFAEGVWDVKWGKFSLQLQVVCSQNFCYWFAPVVLSNARFYYPTYQNRKGHNGQ